MWLSWVGIPGELFVDAGSELSSDNFMTFLQSHDIRATTISPEAHFQNGSPKGMVPSSSMCWPSLTWSIPFKATLICRMRVGSVSKPKMPAVSKEAMRLKCWCSVSIHVCQGQQVETRYCLHTCWPNQIIPKVLSFVTNWPCVKLLAVHSIVPTVTQRSDERCCADPIRTEDLTKSVNGSWLGKMEMACNLVFGRVPWKLRFMKINKQYG